MKRLLCSANCVLLICGCMHAQKQLEDRRFDRSPLLRMRETVTFEVKDRAIELRFTREQPDVMWIGYFTDISKQAAPEHAHVAGFKPHTNFCAQEDIVATLDGALEGFAERYPNAKIDSLCLDMHLSRELWEELCLGLGQRMASLSDAMGAQTGEGIDGSSELRRHIWSLLKKSPRVMQIESILKKHGLTVEFVGTATPILFDSRLMGKKWSEIGEIPSLGIEKPGVIEFNFGPTGATILR